MTGSSDGPVATPADTMRVLATVLAPTLGEGVIVRRPAALAFAERLQVAGAGVRTMQHLRSRYTNGPVRLAIPRRFALVLEPADVGEILHRSPEPFALATTEKVAALRHFQPNGVLISTGRIRRDRRRFNERVLQNDRGLHALAEPIAQVVMEEGGRILDAAQRAGELSWAVFADGWWRAVRTIVLGTAARDDTSLIEELHRLRSAANWAYLHPQRTALRERFRAHLDTYLRRGDPLSLAGLVAASNSQSDVDSGGQIPHWLFAFDAAGITTFRTLALLSSHPAEAAAVQDELSATDLSRPALRSCVLDAVRLWPTTPLLLRESTGVTTWHSRTIPAGTTFAVFTPYFHRDRARLPYADSFEPEIWRDGRADADPALVPFSAGPGRCPGENLVLLTVTSMLAALQGPRQLRLTSRHQLDPSRPLPATLNHFALRFAFTPG